MSAIRDFSKPVVPDSVKDMDPDVVVEVLSRHSVNVSAAAAELGVPSGALRRLLWSRPALIDAAVELEERRLDLGERNILEALDSADPRTRLAAGMFALRNSHRARRRGWITTSTSAAELSISGGGIAPRRVVFRFRGEDAYVADDPAEEGVQTINVVWGKPNAGEVIENDPAAKLSNEG